MSKTKGHSFKDRVGCTFFAQRVLRSRNALPGMVVEADLIVVFKRLLYRHIELFGMEYSMCDATVVRSDLLLEGMALLFLWLALAIDTHFPS